MSVIVMTFWYVFGTDFNFFELFILFSLGIDHDPHVLYVHMTYVYSIFLMFHSSHDHMAKRSHYRIMIFFDFGVLLIYGRIPTLVFSFFLLPHTTPILAIDVLVIRTDLEKDSPRTRRMEIWQIPAIWRWTMFGPD